LFFSHGIDASKLLAEAASFAPFGLLLFVAIRDSRLWELL
jgi:hypothetical protein